MKPRHSHWLNTVTAVITLSSAVYADSTWTGDVSTSWADPLNWDNGVPGGHAFINSTPGNIATIEANLPTAHADIIIGRGAGTNGRLDHTAGFATTGNNNWTYVGQNGGTGIYNLADTSVIDPLNPTGYGLGTGSLKVGGDSPTSGELRIGVGDNSNGTFNINTEGTLTVPNNFFIGEGLNATATVNFHNGTINSSNWTVISRNNTNTAVVNMSGGTWNKTGGGNFIIGSGGGTNGATGSGTLNQTGGLVNITGGIAWVGEFNTGVHNFDDGEFNASQYRLGVSGTGNGTAHLNGGILRTGLIEGGAGNAVVHFNGTQIVATGSHGNFINNLDQANVGDGGLNIDVQNHILSSAQNFAGTGTGGLTLSGTTGILHLSGTNTWTGDTVINGGNLFAAAPGSLPGWDVSGKISVASGGGLGGRIGASGFSEAQFGQLLGNASFATGTNITVDSDGISSLSGDLGTATSAGTDVGVIKTGPNVLALTGTNTYTGNTSVLSGTLIAANDSTLDLTKVSVSSGAGFGGRLGGTGFGNEAELSATLGAVTFAANSFVGVDTTNGNFTFTGDAGNLVSGVTRLHKVGENTLTLTGDSTFAAPDGNTAGLRVDQGTLRLEGGVTAVSTGELWIGSNAGAGAHLELENATLNVASWLSVSRGNGTSGHESSLTATDSTITSGNFSSGYDAGVPGYNSVSHITLNDSTWSTGNFNLGENAGAVSTMTLNGNSVFTAANRVLIGQNTGSTGHLILNDNAGFVQTGQWLAIGQNGTGTMTVKDNAYYTNTGGDFNVADVANSSGTLNLQDNGTITAAATFIGKGENAIGVFNQSGGTFTAGGNTILGNGTGSFGTINLENGTYNANGATLVGNIDGSTGTVNQTGGSYLGGGGDFFIGANGNGTWNQSAGNTTTGGWLVVGRHGSGVGELNLSGGTLTSTGQRLQIGEEGIGVVNLSGTGVLEISAGGDIGVILGSHATAPNSSGTLNLNGGTLITRDIRRGNGTGIVNFNGGLLQAKAGDAQNNFMNGLTSANILAGGARIDSNGNNITIGQNLLDGGGNGGLAKLGSGTLTLTGANTYTGATVVEQGTLALGAGGSIAFSTTIDVQAGATLDVLAQPDFSLASGQTLIGDGNVNAGTFSIGSGANLSPGYSIGSIEIAGNLAFGPGSTLTAEISPITLAADLLVVTGNLNIDAAATLALSVFGGDQVLAEGDKFTLIDYEGTWDGGTFAGYSDGSVHSIGANQYHFNYNDGGAFTLTVVPEPSAALLGGLGAFFLLRRRRSS